MGNVARCLVLVLVTGSVVTVKAQETDPFADAERGSASPFGEVSTAAERPEDGAATHSNAPLKLEFRIADTEPGEGRTRVGVREVIYLHPEVVATADHILEARKIGASTGVKLMFTSVGAARIKQATEQNPGKRMVLFLDGTVYFSPINADAGGREMQITELDFKTVRRIVEGTRSHLPEWELRIGVPWEVDGFTEVNDPKRDRPVWVSTDGILTKRDVVHAIRADRESLTLQMADDVWERVRASTPNAGKSFIAELVTNGEHALTLDAEVIADGGGGFDGLASGSFLVLSAADPNDVREVASVVAPPQYEVFLLVLKERWSIPFKKSPYPEQLKAKLKDAQIDQNLRDQLPHSGPRIFFNRNNVGYFTPEHFSEILAWLSMYGLVKRPLVRLGDAGVGESFTTTAAGVLLGDSRVLDSIGTDRPFVQQNFEFDWKMRTWRNENSDQLWITRDLMHEQIAKGVDQPERRGVDTGNIYAPIHAGHIAVANVFSHRDEMAYRRLATDADLIPLLVLMPRGVTIRQDANHQLHVPDIVEVANSRYGIAGGAPNFKLLQGGMVNAADVRRPDLSGDIDQLRRQSREADRTARELAQEFLSQRQREKAPTKTEMADIRKKLEEAVRRAYELRQQLHLAEIKQMQEKLNKAEATVKERRDQQEQIIRRRVDELLNPTLTWDSF